MDLQKTRLSLEPVCEFQWPPRVFWKRFTHDIQQTEDTSVWFLRCASKELEKHGAPNVAVEQAKLFGERLLRMVELPTFEEAFVALQDFFDIDCEYLFEDEVN
eukprot:9877715-Lingulodinium_polyedra.AAC.1